MGTDVMPALLRLRKAIDHDAPLLTKLEQSAGLAYRADAEIAWVADGENLSPERYREIIADGWSWLAEDEHAGPVAFIAVTREGRELHVWEFDVRLDCQRRGIGRRLLQHLIAEATAAGISAITLTTFRDIAWNGPFYQSMGFEPLAPDTLDERLAALLATEVEKGLPAARRCAMRRVLLP